jgi:hypothetical protein
VTPEAIAKLGDLARNDVPLLQVCGSIDPLLGRNALVVENIYQQLGGRVSMMIKEGYGHHPHSLRDPKPIADFIEQSVQTVNSVAPDYLSGKITINSFYGVENADRDFPNEGSHITCRGPLFSGCYNRYTFDLPGIEGMITVIAPSKPAPGTPWVLRADFVNRDARVDLGLLAKGFHIVTGPVPYNADGPSLAQWDTVYKHLTDHGFSKKPVMEGAGGAAGDVYAWAIQNPDKVSCIYAENPILRSTMSKTPLLDNLAPLAKAGVPLLNICGSRDPSLDDNTRALEKRYKDLAGEITVIVREGEGHFLAGNADPTAAVDFIMQKTK